MHFDVRLSSSENQWVLEGTFYSLGRSRTADLQINRSEASRIHIFFFHHPTKGFLVTDAGSRNGATINGETILEPTLLHDADVIDVASEPLHLNFSTRPGAEAAVRGMQSMILLTVVWDDTGTDWGEGSRKWTRAMGEWYFRSVKIIRQHGGHPTELGDGVVAGVWDGVGQGDRERIQSAIECARQINQFTVSLDETLRYEWGLENATPLFCCFGALHYSPVKYHQNDRGQYILEGDEPQLMFDLAEKARELDCPIISSERFPSEPDDRSKVIPMCMSEVGERKAAMVLFPLRED